MLAVRGEALGQPRTRCEITGPYRVGMAFDVARIRGLFPALGDGWIHLDGSAGMLVPNRSPRPCLPRWRPRVRPGGGFPASQRAESIVAAARRAVADLTGADPDAVVLGPNAPALLSRLADTLADTWTLGDEVVVSGSTNRRTPTPGYAR